MQISILVGFCGARHIQRTRFYAEFRMNKSTFLYICEQLHPELQHSDMIIRTSIAVNKRVAVKLWFLATPSEYQAISHLFGIGRSTVCCIIHETVRAIIKILLKKYITFPTGSQLQNVIQGLKRSVIFHSVLGQLMEATSQFRHQN